MKDVTCPYCLHDQEICHDDGFGYEESTPHQQECPNCGKIFVFYTEISFYYEAFQADCLNGGEHDYQSSYTYPIRFTTSKCTICGKTRNLTNE